MALTEVDVARLNNDVFAATGTNKNRIINGNMRIDQRNAGASVTLTNSATTYTVDRFGIYKNHGATITAQQSTVAPTGFVNSLLVTVTAGSTTTAANEVNLYQGIEGFNIADLGFGTANASKITISFWVRSSVTGTFSGGLLASGAARNYVFTYTISAANTWEKKTITVSGDITGTWLTNNQTGIQLSFDLGAGSNYETTAGSWSAGNKYSATGSTKLANTTGATFYITGVQLEAGDTATPFERRSYGQELSLCQRYYQAIYGSTAGQPYFARNNAAGIYQGPGIAIQFKVSMRAAPTATRVGTWTFVNLSSQPNANSVTTEAAFLYADSSGTGDCYFLAPSPSVGYTFSAEL